MRDDLFTSYQGLELVSLGGDCRGVDSGDRISARRLFISPDVCVSGYVTFNGMVPVYL